MSFLRALHHSSSEPVKEELKLLVEKIVSGGQTGVDRAALDAAIQLNVTHGGWCPKGRKAEDGVINDRYQLIETETAEYSERTKLNIKDSDGTLILVPITPIKVTDGTILTIAEVKVRAKPYLIIDLSNKDDIQSIIEWINDNKIKVLNIAGPRESQAPGIHMRALVLLNHLFVLVAKSTSDDKYKLQY